MLNHIFSLLLAWLEGAAVDGGSGWDPDGSPRTDGGSGWDPNG
jgi:hypothetical protein